MDPDAVRAPRPQMVLSPLQIKSVPANKKRGVFSMYITYQNEKELYYPDQDQVCIQTSRRSE